MAQINKPTDHMNTILYTGDGASSKSITGVGFKPDLVWIKSRSNTDDHTIFNAVSGTQKYVESNNTDAQATITNGLSSFDSDGFTVGTHTPINRSSGTHVAWNFKAANSSGTANTDGTVNSTVSVNSTTNFSIVTFTAPSSGTFSVGHGLGVAPTSVWLRRTDTTQNWITYWKTLGSDKWLKLNATDAEITNANMWQDTHPTSTVFYSDTGQIGASGSYVAFCFTDTPGYLRTGQYLGNGSTDGHVEFCGLSPQFLLIKRAGSTGEWYIFDKERPGYNTITKSMRPSTNATETVASGYNLDFTSTGFKLRSNSAEVNANASSYIYMAIGKSPIVGTNNIPATAAGEH